MSRRVSRKKLAEFIALNLAVDGDYKACLEKVAGYLVENRRTKELNLILDDVAYELQNYGIVNARVSSRNELLDDIRTNIERFIKNQTNAKSIILNETIDTSIIGGIKLEIPGKRLDSTINNKLNKFVLSNKR